MPRYRLSTLLILITIITAVFGGRVSTNSRFEAIKREMATLENERKQTKAEREEWKAAYQQQLKVIELIARQRRQRVPNEAEPGVYFLGPINE